MRRRNRPAALATAALAGVVLAGSGPGAARADFDSDLQACNSPRTAPQASIAACSRLLTTGRFDRRNLSVIYGNRGSAYGNLKRYHKAIVDYTKAIRLNPSFAPAYVGRGAAFDYLKQYQKAIAQYDEAIRLDSRNALAYYNRGITYKHMKQFPKAVADFAAAIRLNPRYSNAYYNRAISYENLGKRAAAIADYKKALQLNPKGREIREALRRLGVNP